MPTAANMANIDTPGYPAMGMDVEAEMRIRIPPRTTIRHGLAA
jgi:flagellar basal body rod protein FlgB